MKDTENRPCRHTVLPEGFTLLSEELSGNFIKTAGHEKDPDEEESLSRGESSLN